MILYLLIEIYPDIRILPKEKDVTSTAFDY